MDQNTLDWADLHQSISQQTDDPSFLSSAGDWLAQGVPLAVASGVTSMINTGISLGNVLGLDAEKIDLGAKVSEFDDSLGSYYQKHKEGIDLGGFLATSIVPGAGGIKALKMLQGGVAGKNAAEIVGAVKNTNNMFGVFRNAEGKFTEKALERIRSNNEIFSSLDNDKLLAIASGVGDQALQGAAFQTAVLATMNQSPVLSKADEDYFTSFARNSPEIFTAALIQGGVGGALEGLGIAGKLKSAIKQRDTENFPSQHVKVLGLSDIDNGTSLAIDIAYLQDKSSEFLKQKQAGTLTDPQILGYQKTIDRQTNAIREKLTKTMIGTEDANPLNDQLWKLIQDADDPAEAANLVLTAATKISRITAEDETPLEEATKVMTSKGALPARKATNVLTRNKVAPEAGLSPLEDISILDRNGNPFSSHRQVEAEHATTLADQQKRLELLSDPSALAAYAENKGVSVDYMQNLLQENATNATQHIGNLEGYLKSSKGAQRKTAELQRSSKIKWGNAKSTSPSVSEEQIGEWTAAGYEMYKDSSGTLHLLEDSPYAKQTALAASSFQNKNPSLILKIAGTEKGKISEVAFPVVGDLGKISMKGDNLLVDGKMFQPLPDLFNPLTNEPLVSNAQFVKASLMDLKPLIEDEGALHIVKGDIPLLERIAAEGNKGEIFYGGSFVDDPVGLLVQKKLALRQQLVNKGHGFDRIARELNVTRDWAENASGDGFMLSKLEDHTQPLHAKIDYATGNLPDGFLVRGVATLKTRVYLGREHNQVAAAAVLGPYYQQLLDTDGVLLNPSTMPQVGGFATSALPDYGSLDNVLTQAGKVINLAHTDRGNKIFQAMQGYDAQIRQDPSAAAELSLIVNKIRSYGEPVKLYESPEGGTLVVPKSLFGSKDFEGDLAASIASKQTIAIKSQVVADYINANQQIISNRATQWNQIFSAMGSSKTYDVDQLYMPPINVKKYPFVAFVKEKMDMGGGDIKEAGVVVAPTAQQLEAKINQLKVAYGEKFDFFTPSDIKSYRKIQGEYESDTPFLGSSLADSALKKEGLLYEFQPRLDAEILNDMNAWHWNQEGQVIRQAVHLKYAEEFAELGAMGKRFELAAQEKFGEKDLRASAAKNPYYRYIATGLNKSSFEVDSLWGKFNGMVETVGQKIFSAWDTAWDKAFKGEIDWEAANKMAESHGFTAPYKAVVNAVLEDYKGKVPTQTFITEEGKRIYDANKLAAFNDVVQPRIEGSHQVQGIVAKINGAVSTLTLGLDALNSLLNVVSFPILGLSEMRNVLANIKDKEVVGALADLTSVKLPGAQYSMPSPMKLLTNAVQRMFGPDKEALAKFYQDIGAIRSNTQLYTDLVNSTQLTKDAISSPQALSIFANNVIEKAKKFAEVGKTVTGYNRAEFSVRFLAADMMKQILDTAKVPIADQPAYINAFVNRVHGNYLANQRPQLFQGPVGQAISLFQTYQFNIMQNMVRYVETGNKTTAAMLLGLQNTLFGLQGNPAFYLLNQAVGNSNREHVDIVNSAQTVFGGETSKWLLYGLGANTLQTSLYNRGDLTPRYATIVPTDPAEIPGIAIPLKAVTSFLQAASNIQKGGNIANSLLDGLAHFGANRPLAGLAQLTQGYRTSSKGDMLTSYSDLSGWAVASKLAGGEELNRSIALDMYYRTMAYKAKDSKTINNLGGALKTTMYKGQMPSQDQVMRFMQEYTDAGGSPIGFNRFIQNSFKNANQSQLNQLKAHINTRTGRLMASFLGGDSEPDFVNNIGQDMSR